MDSTNFTRSRKLTELSKQLRDSKPFSDETSNAESNQSERLKKRAAVLICLFEEGDDLRVILTKRSSKLSSYSGEVSLPGGRRDEGDADDVQTALREAKEEIGLDPSLVDVVTVLEPFVTKGQVVVVPVIGILWDKKAFKPILNAEEVESIFDAPLEMFLKDEHRREEEREYNGDQYVLQYFDHKANNKEYVVWALTAGILIEAASIVYQRRPEFQPRMPKFWKRNHSKF